MRQLSENPTETCLIRTHLGRRSAVPSDNLHKEKNLKNTEAALARACPLSQLGKLSRQVARNLKQQNWPIAIRTESHICERKSPAGVTSGWQDGVRRMGGHVSGQRARRYLPIAAPLSSVRNSDGTGRPTSMP
ncbi:hypothetical protein VZT92_027026 [Zoarces viviparus]|uniref:Ribosomal protein S14 n=1 Tax=Zoarces viviparus TaxID=48416 RepID=A0AAW1DTW5_ZOAVI